ncbi:alpha-hydroxy-acid oxidizing protein [Butyrivibrio sp. VCD2006]|uniref:alpha-hydroxy-acid oxidizing protein n=1 Tax=Butyrivibrio sp. VCD2006 TaxID=1280664 RepID=UPI00040EC266|nr:alpha-hydroxy-acid oxidizing protein [Butyrivibrio sp. VCD2006]
MAYTRLSDANEITERYMDSLLIEQRLIDSVVADTKATLFGEEFSMPVLTPAFSHLSNYNGREYTGLEEYSIAAKESNILNFCGMMENDMFQKIMDTGAKTVRIVKPYADNGKVRDQLQFAEAADAAAVGRPMLPSLEKDGAPGVVKFLEGIRNELRFIMSNTGFKTVSEIDDSALYQY